MVAFSALKPATPPTLLFPRDFAGAYAEHRGSFAVALARYRTFVRARDAADVCLSRDAACVDGGFSLGERALDFAACFVEPDDAADACFANDRAFVEEGVFDLKRSAVASSDAADILNAGYYRGDGVGEFLQDAAIFFPVYFFVCSNDAADVFLRLLLFRRCARSLSNRCFRRRCRLCCFCLQRSSR